MKHSNSTRVFGPLLFIIKVVPQTPPRTPNPNLCTDSPAFLSEINILFGLSRRWRKHSSKRWSVHMLLSRHLLVKLEKVGCGDRGGLGTISDDNLRVNDKLVHILLSICSSVRCIPSPKVENLAVHACRVF